jgi:DNA-binding GntR family transcriptional regulator
VHHALGEAITHGTIALGARLREVEVATQLGVSATPVREALRRLEREGLVIVNPHRGATVVTFTPTEIAGLYEVHEILESHAVHRAAEADDRDTAALEHLLEEEEATLTEPDQQAFNRLDLRFHRTLNELSGNGPLAELTEQVHRRIQSVRIRFDVHLPNRPTQSHAQHKELLAAVRDGDADRAEALARTHIRTVRDAVLTMLSEQAGEASEEVMTPHLARSR